MSTIAPAASSVPLPFRSLIDRWFPLTYVLDNFSRGLGLPDAYPFVLSSPAIAKLQYVHEAISGVAGERVEIARRSG
jgi:hypothetical protein